MGQQLFVSGIDGGHPRLVGNYGPNTVNVGWSHDDQLLFIGTGRDG
jgi:hypothetical protein